MYILSYILGTNLSPDVNLTNPVNICKKKKKKRKIIYIYIYIYIYNPKSEKVGTVWKMQIKKESSDF